MSRALPKHIQFWGAHRHTPHGNALGVPYTQHPRGEALWAKADIKEEYLTLKRGLGERFQSKWGAWNQCGSTGFAIDGSPNRRSIRNAGTKISNDLKYREICKMHGITEEQVVKEIASIAFQKSSEVEREERAHPAVRLRALDMLARFLGIYEKDNAQKLANTQLLQIAFVSPEVARQQGIMLNSVANTDPKMAESEELKKERKNIEAQVSAIIETHSTDNAPKSDE